MSAYDLVRVPLVPIAGALSLFDSGILFYCIRQAEILNANTPLMLASSILFSALAMRHQKRLVAEEC